MTPFLKSIVLPVFAFVLCATLPGCASPPGSFKKEDFTWKQITVNASYEMVYSRYIEASRKCVGAWDIGLVGYVFQENKSGYFDLFLPSMNIWGADKTYVAGKVDFYSTADQQTQVNIGILNKYSNSTDSMGHRKQAENVASGVIECLKE